MHNLVLLPGLMCDRNLFLPQLEALSGTANIVVPELIHDSTLCAMAERVLQDIPFKSFAVAGLSMGGIVAMEIIRQAPERVERLALLDTNYLPDGTERKRQRRAQIERARRGELGALMMQELKPFYVASQNLGNPALNRTFMQMAVSLGPEVFERQAQMLLHRPSAQTVLEGFDKPALVLCGEHDQPCPVSLHEEMHALLSRSKLVVVPDAGHITTLENPKAVNLAMQEWLNEPD